MRRTAFILLIISVIAYSCHREEEMTPVEETAPVAVEENPLYQGLGIPLAVYERENDEVKRGELFATVLQRRGIGYSVVHQITQVAQGVFDMRKLRVGQQYTLLYSPEAETPRYMIYQETPRTFVCFALADSLFVSRYTLPIDVRRQYVEVTINRSLWQDLQEAGYNPMIANSLSEVYAWTIDFFGLQKGDSFRAYYDAHFLGEKELEPGPLLAAAFTHQGKTYQAFRFVQDSMAGYWDRKGENLQKAFLKAPLKYTRISSGFSHARKHPVTRVVRPHTGVDYAAPTGTPVMSIGQGTVVERTYTKGGGNQVKIKHNGVYTSGYLHLSRFASGLKVGQRVAQGEVIGYVGSTGMSTGPHLDFRVWQNGQPINPLKMESPPADPIKPANKEAFAAETAYYARALTPGLYEQKVYQIMQLIGIQTPLM